MLPVVQSYTAQGPHAADFAAPSNSASVVAIAAATLWSLATLQGIVGIVQRLLTLSRDVRAQTEARLVHAKRASLGQLPDAKFEAALRRAQFVSFKKQRTLWISAALLQFAITIGTFAFFFWILGIRDTAGACSLDGGPSHDGRGVCDGHFFLSALHLSIVTITTLGYGDVLPIGAARWLADLEAILGIFYAGVIIAGLIKTLEPDQLE
jgi:Ion channel